MTNYQGALGPGMLDTNDDQMNQIWSAGNQSNSDLGLISSTDTLSSDQSYLLNTFNRYLGRD